MPATAHTRTKAERPTMDQIRSWPPTVNVEDSAAALGVSRSHLYEQIRQGNAPVRTLTVGSRTVVVTSSILALLEPSAA